MLKGITAYLSSTNTRSAVYNDDLTLAWTNCDEFFGKLDTRIISDAFPLKGEEQIAVTEGNSKYAMSVAPLYRSKRLVCGYVCTLRDSFEIYRMINSSAISDFNELFLKDSREKLSRIISINKAVENILEKSSMTDKAKELMREQYKNAERLYTEVSNSMALSCTVSEDEDPAVNCNISILLKGLCTEAAQCLVKTKRKLIRKLDDKNYYAKIDYKTFSVAFLGAFRSHLYISPLKSDIEVISRFDGGDYIITVTSKVLPETKLDHISELKAQQDLELARKIVGADCGGSLTFTQNGEKAISVMRVPVIKKNRGPLLNSANSEYLTGNYRPVKSFTDEITEKEELALRAEGAAAKAKGKK